MKHCEICTRFTDNDDICEACAYKAKLREQLLRAVAVRRGDTK